MAAGRIQWNGENENDVFDFARPFAFRDYTERDVPMKLRMASGWNEIVPVGSWIVKTEHGFIVATTRMLPREKGV